MNKITKLLVLLFIINSKVDAQDCATVPMDSVSLFNQPWFGNNDTLYSILNEMGYYNGQAKGSVSSVSQTKYIPITTWIWDNDAGNGAVIK